MNCPYCGSNTVFKSGLSKKPMMRPLSLLLTRLRCHKCYSRFWRAGLFMTGRSASPPPARRAA